MPPQRNQGQPDPGSRLEDSHAPTAGSRTAIPRQQAQGSPSPTAGPRTVGLRIKPAGGRAPAVSPRPGATGHRDYSPVLLVLRDIPLGDQTRILAGNKHLLRRLNNAADQSIITAHLHAHALRGNKSRTITLLLTATLLRRPIPARQNLSEVPINHLRRLQRIPPSLLRRNISDRKVKGSNVPIRSAKE